MLKVLLCLDKQMCYSHFAYGSFLVVLANFSTNNCSTEQTISKLAFVSLDQ